MPLFMFPCRCNMGLLWTVDRETVCLGLGLDTPLYFTLVGSPRPSHRLRGDVALDMGQPLSS